MNRRLVSAPFALLVVLLAADADSSVLWKDNDDLPIPEPAADDEGEFKWWLDARSLTFYQAEKVVDLGESLHSVGRWIGIASPREAANANAVDEVPDSTWYTNRHAVRRLSREELERGSPLLPPPSERGPITITGGKGVGVAPGFFVRDAKGDAYLFKFDPEGLPELGSGAEQVSSRIVWALGWNVPSYFVVDFDPERLVVAPDATFEDDYNRKQPMSESDLEKILAKVPKRPGGLLRASASGMLPGMPKGPFSMEGLRADDPNDTIPHEDRRDLRGFRVVAAWIHHTDFREQNTLDTFHPDPRRPGWGHLVHYLLDFSSSLGAAGAGWKEPHLGSEYAIDPPQIGANALTLGFWVKPWEDLEVVHRALGRFSDRAFDPESWVTDYPHPIFDRATLRDVFWGAKLVASFEDEDLHAVVSTGRWSDPAAHDLLFRILRERRDRIARAYFDARRANPTDRFGVESGDLRFDDWSVASGVVPRGSVRYRHRVSNGPWTTSRDSRIALPESESAALEIQASQDADASWSPSTRVTVVSGRIVEVDRRAW